MSAFLKPPAGHPHAVLQAPPASQADRAATLLRHTISAANAPLRQTVETYRTATAGFTPDADLLDVLRAAGEVVLAAEAIAAAGKQVEAIARTALANCMAEIGCPSVALANHVVHLSTRPDRVDITDQGAVPAELMRQPPAAPNKIAIGKLLRAGAEVPGARLLGSNQEPICIFRSRSS